MLIQPIIEGLVGIVFASGAVVGLPFANPVPAMPRTYVASCDYTCRPCSWGHDIVKSVDNDSDANHLENCNPSNCQTHECDNVASVSAPSQDNPRVPVGEIWWAVRHADEGEWLIVLEKYNGLATYNSKRQAIQIRGCSGLLVASIPVSQRKIAVLDG